MILQPPVCYFSDENIFILEAKDPLIVDVSYTRTDAQDGTTSDSWSVLPLECTLENTII